MVGRIYDPNLGRFLQADPFIQAPSNTQNHNRYSYVLNNPMSYTDPSGFFFKKIFKALAKVPILNTAIQVGLNFIPGCQAWCSAVYSGLQTYSLTGSLGAGIRAGLIAYATAQAFQKIGDHFTQLGDTNIGELADTFGTTEFDDVLNSLYDFGDNLLTSGQIVGQIASHAVVGGISSALQGGKFGHGFVSAGVTKGIGGAFLVGGNNLSNSQIFKNSMISAVIGGTASKIFGGKFVNGANTAAFQYLFNQAGESLLSGGCDEDPECFDPREISEEGPTWDNFVEYNTEVTPWFVGGGIGFGVKAFRSKYIIDGFSKGLKHGEGRIFGIRSRSTQKPKFRLDYHTNPSPTKLHLHFNGMHHHRPWYSPWMKY